MVASIEYINDEECDPAILRKREYVYKEIVETEKGYIGDLKIILDVSWYTCTSNTGTYITCMYIYVKDLSMLMLVHIMYIYNTCIMSKLVHVLA